MKLIKTQKPVEAERIETDDRPEVGSWWWCPLIGHKPYDADRDGKYLACVIEVGSNYVKVKGVRFSDRLSIDYLLDECTPELNPDEFISFKLDHHKTQVRELMGEVKRVCAQLGVPMNAALTASTSPSTALAVAHDVSDVNRHKKALVKAKDKTLPELFKKISEQHEEMAKWMKAELIPAKASLEAAKAVTEVIEGKIHTMELYAGLQEELVQVREGDPADASTKVTLIQTRHYMDEECLARYEAGGMDFKDVWAFDKWLARDENMFRLLPHPRCIVAFRVRRNDKKYGGERDTLANFIKFWQYNEANKHTFLYIRNGHQLWRMETSIEFNAELFPNQADSDLLGNAELWIKESEYDLAHDSGVITANKRAGWIEDWKAERSYCAQALWQWHRAGCPEGKWSYVAVDDENEQYSWKGGEVHETEGDPRRFPFGLIGDNMRHAEHPAWREYVRLTPESIYYDDVMRKTQKAALEQNRIAVIVQGLLDRSTCLHPHPPWRIWTPEGFAAGVDLVYDTSRAITAGEKPDWEGYVKQLSKSIKTGCHTIGQYAAWHEWAVEHYHDDHVGYYHASGAGPKFLDRVAKLWSDGTCSFRFVRSRRRGKWVPSERPGYIKKTYDDIEMSWRTPKGLVLFCVEAYTPGDFHIFFDDPRTRAEYLEWAPYLLTAENWHYRRQHPTTDGEETDETDDE